MKQGNRNTEIMEGMKRHSLFLLLFAAAAVYEIWRMFAMAPWYDELYTYQNFIDRGMIYSMIHWPLPNNHVFFSALSALLNHLGNPYIGLRGVSLLASLGSLYLLYRLLLRFASPVLGAVGCALFLSMYNVTMQAAQGRGYALSGFFLLLAAFCLAHICVDEKEGKKRLRDCGWYVLFAGALTGGLYTIPSNLYWVVPVCLAGGCFLLFHKEIRKLLRLIVFSLLAAAVTFGLYSVIWLAIGSNFITKDESHALFGTGHFYVLSHAPLDAFTRGMNAMLSDPNIQSISRQEFWDGFGGYLERLCNQVYQNTAPVLPAVVGLGLAVCVWGAVQSVRKRNRTMAFFYLYALILTGMIPLFLMVQCVFPYLRVFTYAGSVLAILFVLLLHRGLAFFAEPVREKRAAGVLAGLSLLLVAFCWSRPVYNMGYDTRDNQIKAALDALDQSDLEDIQTVLVGDVYAELNVYFHIQRCLGKTVTMDSEQPDYVLLDKIQTTPEGNDVIWPYTRNTDSLPWDWIGQKMEVVYENEQYIAYQKTDRRQEEG